jgi:hypothetical protein
MKESTLITEETVHMVELVRVPEVFRLVKPTVSAGGRWCFAKKTHITQIFICFIPEWNEKYPTLLGDDEEVRERWNALCEYAHKHDETIRILCDKSISDTLRARALVMWLSDRVGCWGGYWQEYCDLTDRVYGTNSVEFSPPHNPGFREIPSVVRSLSPCLRELLCDMLEDIGNTIQSLCLGGVSGNLIHNMKEYVLAEIFQAVFARKELSAEQRERLIKAYPLILFQNGFTDPPFVSEYEPFSERYFFIMLDHPFPAYVMEGLLRRVVITLEMTAILGQTSSDWRRTYEGLLLAYTKFIFDFRTDRRYVSFLLQERLRQHGKYLLKENPKLFKEMLFQISLSNRKDFVLGYFRTFGFTTKEDARLTREALELLGCETTNCEMFLNRF